MTVTPINLKDHYQLAIIGCGPAGMAAALNAQIRRLDYVLIGKEPCSPKMIKAPKVENFLGFPELKGEELRQRFLKHLEQMKIEIIRWKVTNVYQGPPFTIFGGDYSTTADTVILAVGVSPQNLFAGEIELLGRGVGYCATCDGPLYADKTVAVIAYNQEGESEANYLAGIAGHVIYIPYYQGLGELDPRIELKRGAVKSFNGNDKLENMLLENEKITLDGVFIIRDNLPSEQLMPELKLAEKAIEVNHNLETNIPGLFAAGDCTGQPYQLLKAAGEGATAALQAVKHLDSLKNKA
ncbi:MAG TPA: NAD(P)/FAD-dependent oxidoreductase [Desulfitobacteriaceae bacterium]|nr:NAD(P)/FAD-dependent oxidoreductase [Desulfitobacteriaceae bacterium]